MATTGIQRTLDRYAEIVEAGQPDEAVRIVDPAAPALQRTTVDLTEELQAQLEHGAPPIGLTALEVSERSETVAEVLIERSWDRRRFFWLFRRVDGEWLPSQPTREEQGEEKALETDSLVLRFRAWDTPLAERLLPQLIEAQAHVRSTLGVASDTPITVTLRSALGPGDEAGKGEFMPGNTPARDRIEVITVGAAFGSFNTDDSWEQALATVFAHEYTHRLNARAPELQPMAEMPTWMTEGLAEYVAGQEHLEVPAFRRIVIEEEPLSLCALNDPNPTTARGVLYGFSQQAVTYIVEQRGGLTAFWNLAAVYRSTPGGGKERMERTLMTFWGEDCDIFDPVAVRTRPRHRPARCQPALRPDGERSDRRGGGLTLGSMQRVRRRRWTANHGRTVRLVGVTRR